MLCLNHFRFQPKASLIAGVLAASVCVSCEGAPVSPAAGVRVPVKELEGFERGRVSVTGRVFLQGQPRNPDTVVKVGGDAFCKSHGEIKSERWKISDDNGLQDAVIFVLDAPATPVRPEQPMISQEGCVYRPHVSAIGTGQSVLIQNDDPTFHNVRIVEHQISTLNKGRNLENYGQPNKGSRHVHRFDQPGVYRLECDVHRWMRSWIYVHSNNHVAVTHSDGSFEIPYGLKDGRYQIAAWHSQFANSLNHEIEVVDGKATVDFTFKASEALK